MVPGRNFTLRKFSEILLESIHLTVKTITSICTQLFKEILVSMVHKEKRDPNFISSGLNGSVYYLLRYYFARGRVLDILISPFLCSFAMVACDLATVPMWCWQLWRAVPLYHFGGLCATPALTHLLLGWRCKGPWHGRCTDKGVYHGKHPCPMASLKGWALAHLVGSTFLHCCYSYFLCSNDSATGSWIITVLGRARRSPNFSIRGDIRYLLCSRKPNKSGANTKLCWFAITFKSI